MIHGDFCNNSGKPPECLNRVNYIQKMGNDNHMANVGRSVFSFDYNFQP